MEKHNYYKIQHLGTLDLGEFGNKPYWFESEPRYYGIDKVNYCWTVDDANKLLEKIKASEKCVDKDNFRIVHCIVTEEVVA